MGGNFRRISWRQPIRPSRRLGHLGRILIRKDVSAGPTGECVFPNRREK